MAGGEDLVNERLQRMARLYTEEGKTYAQIGEEYGISRQRVHQLLKPLGLEPRTSAATRVVRQQRLRTAHAEITAGEKTIDEAAEELGYANGNSLQDTLRELGLRVSRLTEPEHGTVRRYNNRAYRCRCVECRRANREHAATLRASQNPPEHGYSGYKNYGCRCQTCKEANRLHVRGQRAARRQRRAVSV